ncbi:hypothetical protein BDQ12DRAFT_163318 [Crucibulum laeve]|uniref:Uncharacterized protein n=1 Tax=Crucibulum laeve TaxID=68775 RepID=A0A5C3MGM8_9AGAR|nr:hypothetical protein BDQ12DRAFT_163318 [Crucibulum laeve]
MACPRLVAARGTHMVVHRPRRIARPRTAGARRAAIRSFLLLLQTSYDRCPALPFPSSRWAALKIPVRLRTRPCRQIMICSIGLHRRFSLLISVCDFTYLHLHSGSIRSPVVIIYSLLAYSLPDFLG